MGEASPVTVGARRWLAARPAFSLAVLFILGIGLHSLLPNWPVTWLVTLVALLTLAAVLSQRGAAATGLIALSICIAGLLAGEIAADYFPTDHISAFTGAEPRLAAIEVRLTDSPRVIEQEPVRRAGDAQTRQALKASVEGIKTWNGWKDASGEVLISVAPPDPHLAAGDRLRVLGMLSRPPPAMNPGQFDWAKYYRRQRVLASVYAQPQQLQVLKKGSATPLVHLRERFRNALSRGFSEHSADAALLGALLFGDRGPALRELDEQFRRSGTTHLLSSYGLCMALLAGLAYLVCRALCARPRRAVMVVISFAALYGVLVLPSPQALRPVLLCMAVGIGLLFGRSADPVQLLALACLALLVMNPLDLYAAGFQFGFVIVFGFMLFGRLMQRATDHWKDEDQVMLRRLGKQSVRQRGVEWVKVRAARAFYAAMVAWLVALPLVACHFEQLNLWTVPAGFILAPFAMAAVIGGFGKILLTLTIPGAAGAWAMLADIPAWTLRHGVSWMAKLPMADLPMPAPPLWLILLYYATLCLPLVPWQRPRARWCARCAPASGFAALLLLPLGGFAPQSAPPDELRVTLLSIGAGQCAIVEQPGGEAMLVDAGSATLSDPLRTCLAPFLRHEGRRSVARMILSHGDYDHISMARKLVADDRVGEVLASPHLRRHATASKPSEDLLAMLDGSGHSTKIISAGDDIDLGGGSRLEVLWPPRDCDFNSNNTGLVLRLTFGGRSILFPADIQDPAERELLKTPQRLRADVLVAPHHGSIEPSTDAFVRAVGPSVILSSNDNTLSSKQRAFDRLVEGGTLYRTNRCGALTVVLRRDVGIRVERFRGSTGGSR